ncbi:unnamed protein product [Mytilus edulis]|uniref:Uncharacterized protein n=1 Tax=Mytilus edulis TaxID=6550 RepID=A0A8S3ULU1_MYTED|nr:unnamed protein product [Mytilus edulis]
MVTEQQNYERLNKLLNQLVHPTCEKILENHLRENRVSFYQFLETNKHRIMHCFRVNITCCALHADCAYSISATLTKRQWSFLYKDAKTNICRKSGCICKVITSCTTFRNLNLNVICFLIIECSMINGSNIEAVKRLNVFNQEMQVIRTGIVPYSEFQTKWKTTTDSLVVLGVTRQQIDEVNRIPTPTAITPTAIIDKECRNVILLSISALVFCVVLTIDAAGMLQHRNDQVRIGKLKSFLLSITSKNWRGSQVLRNYFHLVEQKLCRFELR